MTGYDVFSNIQLWPLPPRQIYYIMVNLRFTTPLAEKEKVQSIAETNNMPLDWIGDYSTISEWRLQMVVKPEDLCNFTNDLGHVGIQAVCSPW